jgi:hypothetical protein
MAKKSKGAAIGGPAHRSVESAVAIFCGLLALITIGGALAVGIDWGAEGPKAGFFPFYIGLFILGASAINLWHALRDNPSDKLFAEWLQLRQVLSVVIPTAVYVFLIPLIGIYVASLLLIGLFMRWLGEYAWSYVAAVAVSTPIAIFVVFEKWFLVPLPKGPIEEFLGF